MPKQVLPDLESFQSFERSLYRRGFRKLSSGEFGRDRERLGLVPGRPREGKETGYIFSASGLSAVVWTTFLEREGAARDQDSGWVLIREGDEAQYFARPMRRTQNFLDRLLLSACIARLRVLHRPLCPKCGAFMNITRGRTLKQRYWSCAKGHAKETLPWDHGIPPLALQYIEKMRKERARYKEKLAKVGKVPGKALLTRKPWKSERPQNKI